MRNSQTTIVTLKILEYNTCDDCDVGCCCVTMGLPVPTYCCDANCSSGELSFEPLLLAWKQGSITDYTINNYYLWYICAQQYVLTWLWVMTPPRIYYYSPSFLVLFCRNGQGTVACISCSAHQELCHALEKESKTSISHQNKHVYLTPNSLLVNSNYLISFS